MAAVVNSEVEWPAGSRAFHLLDAGCGSGAMMSYLQRYLPTLRPDITWEVHGFDVLDDAVQVNPNFFAGTRRRLSSEVSEVDWSARLKAILVGERWPYPDACFDAVLTNQVLEHVRDLDFFISEVERVLRPGGFSVHLFPVRPVIFEGHVRVPLAHRIHDHDMLVGYIEHANRIGSGRFDTYNQAGDDVSDFAAKGQTDCGSIRAIEPVGTSWNFVVVRTYVPHFDIRPNSTWRSFEACST